MLELFNTIFVVPILNVLVGFYKLFLTIGLPGAFGFSIIGVTVLVRFILHPFFKQQMVTAKKMQDIKPHLDKLSKKHKGDAKKLQAEQMRLYKDAGINPAAGCLFAIVQIPLFIGLYQTLQLFLKTDTKGTLVKEINSDLYFPFLKIQSIDSHFLGLNLALSPSQSGHWMYLLVPVITAAFQYFQNKITLPAAPKSELDKDGKKKESSTADEFQRAMGTQMKYFFPVMIGYFSYTLPIGLSLYWNIFSIFSIIQHIHINKGQVKKVTKDIEKVLEVK